MSTAELPNFQPQTPRQEMAERAAEQSPAWGLTRILATINQWAIWNDARQRVFDDHRASQRAKGEPVDDKATPEPMDVKIAGDTTTINHNYPAPQATTTATTNTTTAGRVGGLLKGVIAGALITALGAGGMAIYSYLTDKPENVTTITHPSAGQELDQRYGIHVYDGPP